MGIENTRAVTRGLLHELPTFVLWSYESQPSWTAIRTPLKVVNITGFDFRLVSLPLLPFIWQKIGLSDNLAVITIACLHALQNGFSRIIFWLMSSARARLSSLRGNNRNTQLIKLVYISTYASPFDYTREIWTFKPPTWTISGSVGWNQRQILMSSSLFGALMSITEEFDFSTLVIFMHHCSGLLLPLCPQDK